MSNVLRTTVWMNGNVVANRKVEKASIKTVMKTILNSPVLSKKPLYVAKGYVSLETDHAVVRHPGPYYGMTRITTLNIPLKGETLKNLSEYHFEYYNWLTTSGRANGSSLLRVIRLTSPTYRAKVGPIVEGIDTIGKILIEFGVEPENDFFHRAIASASKKQMDAVFKKEQDIYNTVGFLQELKANKDLADAKGEKLQNNIWILKMLTNLGKHHTLSPRQIEQSNKVIRLFKYHSSKGTNIPEWRYASDESDLRKKVIRLAHANPHLRSHLLPLVTNKTAKSEFKKGDSVTYKGKDCKIVEVAKNGKVTIKSKGGATKTFSAKDAEKMLK